MPRDIHKNNNHGRNAFTITISLLLALGIVLSITHIIFFARGWQVNNLGGIGKKTQYSQVMDYLEEKGNLPAEMTMLEKSHMADVKSVVNKGKILELCVWVLFIGLGIYVLMTRPSKKKISEMICVIQDASLILLLIICLCAIFSISFDTFFGIFHQIFFPQGNWIFPRDSMLITLFPESFFLAGFIHIVAGIVGAACVLWGIGYLFRKHFAEKA